MKILYILVVFLLIGCQHEKEDNELGNLPSANASGFPDVAGVYSLNTGKIQASCSDGTTAEFQGFSFNVQVVQDDNEVELVNLDKSGDKESGGFKFKTESESKGTVQKNGKFIVRKTGLAELVDFNVDARVNYAIAGTFDADGWYGDYEYTMIVAEMAFNCDYKTTFFGDFIKKQP